MNTPFGPPSTFFDRLQSGAARLWAELQAWRSPLENPFVGQARHLETRGALLFKSLVILACLSAAALFGAWLIYGAPARPDRDFERMGVGLLLGMALLAGLVLGRARDAALLRLEVIKGRFEALQLLPMDAARRAWFWSAPNSLAALTVCATGLPALFWGLGGGIIEWRDALGLAIWALIGCWGAPVWRPALWQMRAEKGAATGTDIWNSAAKSDGFVAPGGAGAMGVGSVFFAGWILLQSGVLGAAPLAYWNGLPWHLRAASADIWVAWPLFAARWLMEAQPFFGFHLAMFWLVVPIWLAWAHNRVLRLGAVTAQQPYWNEARLSNWTRANWIMGVGLVLLVAGLLWPGAIEGGWLASLFRGLKTSTAWALAAWWVVALACGALCATAAARGVLETPVEALRVGPGRGADGQMALARLIGRAARRAGGVLLAALAIFIGACVLGGRWPFGAFWLQVLPATLAVALVWLSAQGVVWSASRSRRLKGSFATLHALWFYGVGVIVALLLILGVPLRALLPGAYYFSPWTLWVLLREADIASNSQFWLAIAGHGALALVGALLVWRRAGDPIVKSTNLATSTLAAFSTATTTSGSDAAKPPSEIAESVSAASGRARSGGESAPVAVAAATATKLTRKPLPDPEPWMKRVLIWARRFGNPLLELELRRLLLSLKLIPYALWSNGIMAFVTLVYLPLDALKSGVYSVEGLTVALSAALIGLGVAPLVGLEGAANAYDRDRLDGSLQMLFLTPRTEAEIGWGKLGPYVLKAALMALALLPIWLLGLVFCPLAGQPMLTTAYLVLPVALGGFNARGAAASHWIALRKRKIGPGHLPLGLALAAICALPLEIVAFGLAWMTGPWALGGCVLVLSGIYALQAWWFWKRALRELRRQRFHGAPVVR